MPSEQTEEFYNAYHDPKTGRFTTSKGRGKKLRVPFAPQARLSYALKRQALSKQKAKEKAKMARKEAKANKMTQNLDKSEPIKGGYKITGNKRADAVAISRLDRDSAERAKAIKMWNKKYGS
jgi:hypothetical protein